MSEEKQPTELEQLREYVKHLEKNNHIMAQALGTALGFIRQVGECKSYTGFQDFRREAQDFAKRYEVIAEERRIKKDEKQTTAPTPDQK